MSLGKLLATGRSLVGGAPDEGRYNISSRNQLPKFGSAKNPFARPAPPAQPVPVELPVEPVVPTVVPTVVPAPTESVEPAAAVAVAEHKKTQVIEYKKTQRIPELAGSSLRPVVQRVLRKVKAMANIAVAFCLATFAKLPGLARRVRARFHRREPKSVIPRFGKPAVQTELSLDRVKVMRNSLEDSDLEIVTAETATSTQVAPKTPGASPKRGPMPPALKKLTERMLGVKSLD